MSRTSTREGLRQCDNSWQQYNHSPRRSIWLDSDTGAAGKGCNAWYVSHTARSLYSVFEEIRKALRYQNMDSRRAQLHSHELATCEWIWNTPFAKWLSSEDPIFWIHGKPASGKSTLVDWLMRSNAVQSRCPPGYDWLVNSFYFDFRAGKGFANHEIGMLRSLLLQLMKLDAIARVVNQQHPDANDKDWTDDRRALLDAIKHGINSAGIRLCAFVDGLDEYEGKPKALMECLLELQKATGCKLVLSSRPEIMIRHYLKSYPSLQMQDYNTITIKSYVESSLVNLEEDELHDLQELLPNVLSQANGVILWAMFVVDELVEARISGATMNELRQVLRTYPSRLDDIYSRILDRLHGSQMEEAQLALLLLSWFSRSSTPGFLGRWSVLHQKLKGGRVEACDLSMARFLSRLHSFLGGLIEVTHNDSSFSQDRCLMNAKRCVPPASQGTSGSMDDHMPEQCSHYGCSIRFVHETVRTYTRERITWSPQIRGLIEGLAMDQIGCELQLLSMDLLEQELATSRPLLMHLNDHITSEGRGALSIGRIQLLCEAAIAQFRSRRHIFQWLYFNIQDGPNCSPRTGSPEQALRFMKCSAMLLHPAFCVGCLMLYRDASPIWMHVWVLLNHRQWYVAAKALQHDDIQQLEEDELYRMIRYETSAQREASEEGDEYRRNLRELFTEHLPMLSRRVIEARFPCWNSSQAGESSDEISTMSS